MFTFSRSNTVKSYGLNFMALFKTYWTVQGISPEAREAAIRAAKSDGEELGVWLTRLIDKVSAEELRSVASNNGATEDKDGDDKLTSIERAMLQSGTTGNMGSA